MTVVRIALAQINSQMGNLAANVEKIQSLLALAQTAQANLVIFPELALSGYPPEDLLLRESFLLDQAQALAQVQEATRDLTVVVGWAEKSGQQVYNAAALLHQQRLVSQYRKIELPNYGVFDEKRYFVPGKQLSIFESRGLRVGLTICEDIWIPGGWVEQGLSRCSVDMVINIAASPYQAGKLSLRQDILARFAAKTKAYMVYVNSVGGQDELVFDGASMILDPQGNVIARARQFQEELLLGDLEIPLRRRKRRPASSSSGQVVRLRPPWSKTVIQHPLPLAATYSEVEEIYHALVLGTQDYVKKNGFEKVVIGISGGVDSALVASLAVAALGRENVVGVTMPSAYTSIDTHTDAEVVAQNLGIPLLTVPIQSIFAAYLTSLRPEWGEVESGVAHENLQARIRGNILMAFSNQFGWLVLTTGNKSETAVGYCTLYGDMAGGFAVIKDVPKTLVYKLADYINQHTGKEVIPASVLQRPPTAELRSEQKDEDTLPTYPMLDPILKAYIEEDKSFDQILAQGFAPEIVAKTLQMVDKSEYKRRQAPPGIKLSLKAFGRDRRLPITNQYPAANSEKSKA